MDHQVKEIHEIINNLLGTCNALEYDDYLHNGFNENKLLQILDEEIFQCSCCGWWYEICDVYEEIENDTVCLDCKDDY